jgi:glycosyltransferase involved in cell wall biosynthesis
MSGVLVPHMKLAIIITHPIQYYAPLFVLLARMTGLEVMVFYGWKGLLEGGHDRDFGQSIQWDIPLLKGYDSEFVNNVAADPGTHHFNGIDLPTLNDRISSWSADAILVFGWSWKPHLKAMRHFHGKIPIYFRGDSTLLDEQPGLKRCLRRVFLRWVYCHVDTAFYVGERNRSYYKAMGLTDRQLTFAPHAIDNERFADPTGIHEKAALEWRQRLGIADDALVFLQVGKIEMNKAPFDVLSAFQQLDQRTDAHLIFAGSGVLEPSLKQHSGDRVHFIGFQNQSVMPTVYRLGDLIVMPSRSESWGLAINEAMACSRAVAVCDRVGCAVDLVRPGRNGWRFSGSGPLGLALVMQEALIAGREQLRLMGSCSASLIEQWSLHRQARAIYDTVTKRMYEKE